MKTDTLVIALTFILGLMLLVSFFVTRPEKKPAPIPVPVTNSFMALTNAWKDGYTNGYNAGQSQFNVKVEANFLRDTWKRGYMDGVAVTASNVIALELGKISSRQLSEVIADGLTNNPWYLVPENR